MNRLQFLCCFTLLFSATLPAHGDQAPSLRLVQTRRPSHPRPPRVERSPWYAFENRATKIASVHPCLRHLQCS
jgi:hypothetical protein